MKLATFQTQENSKTRYFKVPFTAFATKNGQMK
jgi:hypothetical protein